MLPGASDVTLIRTRTASCRVVLLLLPVGGILLPRSSHCCTVFRAFLSAANTVSNAVSAFVVVTSASPLLSLLAVTLSPVRSETERSSEWTVFLCGHFLCVKKDLAGTLLRGTFGSLHVLFLCVHSVFVFMSCHCPICGVEL